MNLVTAKGSTTAAAAILAGAALVPGAKRVLDDAIDEIQRQAEEAALRMMLEELSPESRQIAALNEAGARLFDGFASGFEVLPIRKRPLKPKPHGREALVKRQKKARV